MKMIKRMRLLLRKNTWLPAALCIGMTAVLFQNCSRVGFGQASDVLDSSSISGDSQTVYADFNTPKTFTATFATSVTGLSLLMEDGTTSTTLASGSTLKVTDATNLGLTYTPANGFRSTESATVILKDKYGHQTTDLITFVVANTIRDINPAMAVRTSGCITCHANVASNYITDFGAGSSYFFGTSASGNPLTGNTDALYSDRYGDMSWLTATFSSGIIVPKQVLGFDLAADVQAFVTAGSIAAASLPAANDVVANIKPTNTLGDYLKIMENHKTPSDALNIQQMSSVYIGAPTTALLKSRTAIGSARSRYVKNAATSPELSGLVDHTSYFQADNLVCEGDLVVNGPLYLHNLTLHTDTGCRIYSTGSIFVNGPIVYQQINASSNDFTNIQLVSSEWINMGVGLTQCETASNPGWYFSSNVNGANYNPFDLRMLSYGAPTRAAPTNAAALALNTAIKTEEQAIPGFLDASCSGGSTPRAVAYTRILMNAPRIDSRYTGQVTGIVIAEVAIFGLQRFAFTFDPVFNAVPIIPFLDQADYLSVVQ